MAESVPYSDQLVSLFKTREGYANTNSAYEVEQETLVSRPTMLADRIFLNNVPDNAPTDTIRDGSWNVVGQSAERWTSVARPWLVNYRDIVLTSFAGNPDETFYFAGTRTGGAVLPNLLTNMLLPLMTSTSAPAYTVTVLGAGSAPIPASNYMLDRQAGIITIYPGNGVSATQPPTISFWRYEGTTLRDAAMSTDLNGNVTLGGTLTVTGNVGVGGTLSTSNFSTSTFTTTGLYTATGGISVTNGNLSVTNGTTSIQGLTASGFVTAGNGLTVPAGTLSVANAATVGSLSTSGDISGNTASIAGLLRAGSLSTTGPVTAGSGVSVTGGSLTVTNNTTTGSLTITSGPNTLGAVTTGAITANGPINATAGLSVSGGISIPGANLSLNDLSANSVDVSGTLRVGTGTAGNNLVISTTSGTTSAIRQNKATGGTLQLGSSAAAPSVLTVADTGGAGTVTVNGTLVANTIGTGAPISVDSLLYANKGINVGDPNGATSQYLNIYGTNPGSCYIRPTGGVTPILQLGSSPTYTDTISISEGPRLVTVNTNTIVTGDLQTNSTLKANMITDRTGAGIGVNSLLYANKGINVGDPNGATSVYLNIKGTNTGPCYIQPSGGADQRVFIGTNGHNTIDVNYTSSIHNVLISGSLKVTGDLQFLGSFKPANVYYRDFNGGNTSPTARARLVLTWPGTYVLQNESASGNLYADIVAEFGTTSTGHYNIIFGNDRSSAADFNFVSQNTIIRNFGGLPVKYNFVVDVLSGLGQIFGFVFVSVI